MNKKFLLVVLPLFALVTGCGKSSYSSGKMGRLDMENGLPTIHIRESEHVTYLMLSPFGSIEDYEGVSTKGKVSELFYENTVVLKADPGTPLPDVNQVKSSVNGATFVGWAYYDESNDNVWPDYYDKVPTAKGLALKAMFKGTDASSGGGGGGGGGGGEVTTVTYTVTALPNWLPNDGAEVFVWSWGGNDGNGVWHKLTMTMDGTDGNYTNVRGTFEAPDNITGFNMARCVNGTTAPDWTVKGDGAGRIYNKSGDCAVTYAVTTYSSPSWVEYNP